MHSSDLILTLTGGLAAALVFGYITHRLGLSPIVGYLIAGIAVGPHTPGFVGNKALADQLAEIGVILLMFGVGLNFHIKELLAVRRVAIPGAIGQSLVATVLGAVVATSFGWSLSAGIVFGFAISVASTVVLVRVLADNRDLHTPTGHIAVGWLVVEDLFTVVVLVFLPVVVGSGQSAGLSLPFAVGAAILKIGTLVVLAFLVGGKLLPWLLTQVSATRSRELFTLTVLVLALGIAVSSALLFGVSMALGAFLAGMVVGRSEFSLRAATEALPMRDAFAVLFFVSAGMLFDPAHVLEAPWQITMTLVIILLGKPLAALVIVALLGYPVKVGLAVAAALAQIGEFSFMLGLLGQQLGALPDDAMQTIVAASIISIMLNPILYRLVTPFETWLSRHPRLLESFNSRRREKIAAPSTPALDAVNTHHKAIVVGYGPIGRTVTRLLRENEIHPTVIELNLDAVRRLREEGIAAVYGDVTHPHILEKAGIRESMSLILTASNLPASEEIIRCAKEFNPHIHVLARSTYVREMPALHNAGAGAVFSAEGEVALALTVTILRWLGATPEQIDTERERVHQDIFSTSTNNNATR